MYIPPLARSRRPRWVVACLLLAVASPLRAGGIQTLDAIEVTASPEDLLGTADSATQGTVTRQQLESRPLLRPGELIEAVPGLIITQHSGDGKANQYFLRGFNLDHGTDFSATLDGVPLNLPTHGHGQGYLDLNFLIPELVRGVQYHKGPYFAGVGDFASAGAAEIGYVNALEHGIAELGYGQSGYRRGLLADSPELGGGRLLYAIELFDNDGPWDQPENYEKLNGVLSWRRGDNSNWMRVSAMGYHADWDATDQVPQRAIDSGIISRFGSLDPSDGGKTHRYSLSLDTQRTRGDAVTRTSAYLVDYEFDLFSNFTFFLNDPENGDQFEQVDERLISGATLSHSWTGKLAGRELTHSAGLQLRNDAISHVGLYHTRNLERLETIRSDDVTQTSLAAYYEAALQWSPWLRGVFGLRADRYWYDVASSIPENSGKETDAIASPKLSLVVGPWHKTEYYLNLGYGFHGNDARGTTIKVDPKTLEPAEPVDPLVRSKGAEIGLRTAIVPGLQSSLALWRLTLDSELLFVGDAGTTEASRPSRRHGIEWANYYQPLPELTIDADFALTQTRFTDDDPAGKEIPGAIARTVSVGVAYTPARGWFAGARLRHFGPRPLVEDDSVRSKASTLVSARVGYKFGKAWKAALDVYNLFDREVSDIDYFYTSRLPGEPDEGVADVHTHPAEPRTLRATLTYHF